MPQTTVAKTESLPKAVRKQRDRANALILENARRARGEPPPESAAPPAPEPTAVQPEPPAAPAVEATHVVELQQPAPPTPSVQREETVDYWRQRCSTLQGTITATEARVKGTIEGLEARIQELEGELASRAPAAPAVDLSRLKLEDIWTPEQIKAFGRDTAQDLTNVVVKLATSIVDGRIAPVAQSVRSIAGDQTARRKAAFWQAVDDPETGVPNLESVNADPAFHAWLHEVDDLSGVQRQQLLADAQKKFDANRVIAIFRQYLGLPLRPRGPTTRNLSERVLPPPAGGAAPALNGAGPGDERPVTSAEITAHFTKKARSKAYRDSEQGRANEVRINAAVASGRVA